MTLLNIPQTPRRDVSFADNLERYIMRRDSTLYLETLWRSISHPISATQKASLPQEHATFLIRQSSLCGHSKELAGYRKACQRNLLSWLPLNASDQWQMHSNSRIDYILGKIYKVHPHRCQKKGCEVAWICHCRYTAEGAKYVDILNRLPLTNLYLVSE